jgi:LysR family transcriptional regulator, transcriptional activator of the cysJI operon
MTLRHLTVFITVVDHASSITRAAEVLHVAQPSVSQTIVELEQYYKIKLFDRLNRRLYLTPEGKKLLGYARHLVGSFNELDLLMKTVSEVLPLRIGASFTAGTILLPGILKEYQPHAASVSVFNTHIIEKMILESSLDIAVVEGRIGSPDILQFPVIRDELVFAASPAYCIPENPVFILRESGSGTRELSDAMIAESFAEADLPEKWVVANTQTIIALVKAGLGMTVISYYLIQQEIKKGQLRLYIPPRQIARNMRQRIFHLVYHKDKFIDSRMDAFVKCCETLR